MDASHRRELATTISGQSASSDVASPWGMRRVPVSCSVVCRRKWGSGGPEVGVGWPANRVSRDTDERRSGYGVIVSVITRLYRPKRKRRRTRTKIHSYHYILTRTHARTHAHAQTHAPIPPHSPAVIIIIYLLCSAPLGVLYAPRPPASHFAACGGANLSLHPPLPLIRSCWLYP